MKKFILFCFAAAITLFIATLIKHYNGYVIVTAGHLLIQMRLLTFVVLALITFIVLYYLLRFIAWTFSIGNRWEKWREKERRAHASREMNRGLLAMTEGNWDSAQKHFLKDVKYSPTPLINYLAAAVCAQRGDDIEKRDSFLSQAFEVMPEAKLGIAMIQAQLQLEAAQYEQAIATLQHAHEMSPKQKYILKMLAEAYVTMKDWKQLKNLLPRLEKYNALSAKRLAEIKAMCE